jgi:hypothetical protein
MTTLLDNKNQNKTSLKFHTDYNNYFTPHNKTNSIYFRDTIKQFCPHQRYVDHRPYPYRNFVKPPTDFNYFNNPTDKDSFVPCFKKYPTRELQPLVTRQDLAKYLKYNGKLISHHRPCNSCSRINDGNYGRNYYTVNHKSFPFINGNFTGTNFGIRTGFNSTRNNRSQRLRYKIRDYDNYNTNNEYNNNFNNEYNEINNEYNNEQKANLKDNNIINRNKYSGNEYLGATPKYKRRFHKTQIFNHYKPFMVDDFKEYADYE